MNCLGVVRYITTLLVTAVLYVASSQSLSPEPNTARNGENGTTQLDSPAKPELTYCICGPLHLHMVQAAKYIVAVGRYPVVISTWEPNTAGETAVLESLQNVLRLPMDTLLLHSKADISIDPKWDHAQHIYEHIWIWQQALNHTTTRYAIKMRSSMFFSNVEHVSSMVVSRPKFYTIGFFFRPLKEKSPYLYHPSDMFVGLESSNMKAMLARAMKKVESGGGAAWRVGSNNTMIPYATEQKLFTTFLEVVGVTPAAIENHICAAATHIMMHVDVITLKDLGYFSIQCSTCKGANYQEITDKLGSNHPGNNDLIFSMSDVHETCKHCSGCLSKMQIGDIGDPGQDERPVVE